MDITGDIVQNVITGDVVTKELSTNYSGNVINFTVSDIAGDVNLNGFKMINSGAPVNSGDAVNLGFLNATIGGFSGVVIAPVHWDSTGRPGQIAYDDDYFYVCVSTDRWAKVPLIKNF